MNNEDLIKQLNELHVIVPAESIREPYCEVNVELLEALKTELYDLADQVTDKNILIGKLTLIEFNLRAELKKYKDHEEWEYKNRVR